MVTVRENITTHGENGFVFLSLDILGKKKSHVLHGAQILKYAAWLVGHITSRVTEVIKDRNNHPREDVNT